MSGISIGFQDKVKKILEGGIGTEVKAKKKKMK